MRLEPHAEPQTTAELAARLKALLAQRAAISAEHALYSEWLSNLVADARPLRQETAAVVLRSQALRLASEHLTRRGLAG
jgi:hypothetical protein